MDKIRHIIVDDEPLAIEILEEYSSKIDDLEHLASFDSGIDALNFIKQNSIDLVFLDIQMPDLTGLQMAELIQRKTKVIFTTAYAEYAVDGFELQASDYLLKPISFERFYKAVERIQQTNEVEEADYVFVKSEYKIQKVRFDDILFIEGMKDYLRIVTREAKIMTLQSFSKMEKALPATRFMRVHKSYMISFDKIDGVEKNQVRIGNKLIPIGEAYKGRFLDQIKKHEIK